jgi:hypothetical protein
MHARHYTSTRKGRLAAAAVLASFAFAPGIAENDSARELSTASNITAVMLAGGQAIVTRSGKVQIPPGRTTLIFPRLPQTLVDSSLRFGISGEDKILEIKVEQVTTTEISDDEARKADDDLRAAQARLKELTEEYRTLQEMETFTRGINVDASEKKWDEKNDRLSPGQWKKTIDFMEHTITSLNEEQRALKRRIEAAQEDVQVALVIAERLLSRRTLTTKQARVLVQSAGRSSDFVLSYRTPGANWYPSYSVRVGKKEGEDVKLSAFALVQNRTGEEWNNVRLQLSASNPEDIISLPELREWRIRTAMVVEQTADNRRLDLQSNINPAPAPQRIAQDRMREAEEDDAPASEAQAQKPSGLGRTVTNSRTTLQEAQRITSGKQDASLLGILNQRDEAFKSGDYESASRYSEQFIDQIGKLRPENKKLFSNEEQNSLDIQEKSRSALQNRPANLIAPRPLRGGAVYETRYEESIPSDGILRKVSLFDAAFGADKVYEAAPLRAPFGYLTGRVKYRSDKPLLPGPAQVFYGDDFTGEAVLPETGNNQDIALSLGSTEDIKITRTENRFRETSGLLSTDIVYRIEIQIKIKNSKREPVTMDVYDRVPISEDERVKIEDVTLTPVPILKTSEGLLRFRVQIQASSEQVVTLKYVVRHSSKLTPSAAESGTEF